VPDIPETHHDLLNSPFATLATVGASGRPQLSTIYFLASANGTVQLSVNATRPKLKNMIANPKVALHIQDTAEYIRYLELRGDATVEPDDDYAFAIAAVRSPRSIMYDECPRPSSTKS
jgi:PPOX class probable F420-dependent enzyme